MENKVYSFDGLEVTGEFLCIFFNELIKPTFKQGEHEPDGFKLFKSFISVIGNDINEPLSCGETMLQASIKSKNKKMVKLLMKHRSIKIDDESAKWIKENL